MRRGRTDAPVSGHIMCKGREVRSERGARKAEGWAGRLPGGAAWFNAEASGELGRV